MMKGRYETECDRCGLEIRDGDEYWELDEERLCEECAKEWLQEKKQYYEPVAWDADAWHDAKAGF